MGYPFDCAILRDFVPRLLFLTCSRPTEQVRRISRGRYEDAVASSTAPCGLVLLAGRCFDLQSADWCCNLQLAYILFYFIRKLRFAYIVCIAFFNEEYLIALVDFIVALRRTKGRGRRTLRSPPSPSSGLHLIHPGLSAAAGHYCCRGLYQFRYLVSGAAVYRQFRMLCSYLCSGWYRSRFSRFRWAYVFRFSLVVDGLFVPAATWRFDMDICWDYR